MGFLRAKDLGAKGHECREERVNQWCEVAPIVKGIRER